MIAFLMFACSGSDSSTPTTVEATVQSAGQAAQEAKVNATIAKFDAPSKPEATTGPVTFMGTISYEGASNGTIALEVLDNSSGEPVLMGRQVLQDFGPFSIDVKTESSELTLMAYLDLAGNGISDDDPRGYLKITDTTKSTEGLDLVILDLDALEKKKDGKENSKDDANDKAKQVNVKSGKEN